MKKKLAKCSDLQIMSKRLMTSLKGGQNEEEGEYIIVYIHGKPYRIKIDKNGNPISPP